MENNKIETGISRGEIKYKTLIIQEPIVRIADRAFLERDDIDLVVLPKTIKAIGYRAFYNSSIKEIIFPEGLISIHAEAFDNCLLKRLHFPSSLLYIGEKTFQDNTELTEVDFTETKTLYIDNKAFYNDNIENIDLPCTVNLGNNVFSNNNLKSLKIARGILKKSLQEKALGAFTNNPEIKTGIYQENNKPIPHRKVKKITRKSYF